MTIATRVARRIRRTALLLGLWMLCQIAHIIASMWMLAAAIISPHGRRAWTLAISHDQLINAATGGHEDETISSRAGRERHRRQALGLPSVPPARRARPGPLRALHRAPVTAFHATCVVTWNVSLSHAM